MTSKEFNSEIKEKARIRQGALCAHCGKKVEEEGFPHFRKPAELGGDNSLSNCVILCQNCHHEYGQLGKWGKFAITQDYPHFCITRF